MDIRSRKQLKETAAQALEGAAYSPRRLALIHTGAAVLLSLALTVLNFVLSRQIEGTGGLAGVGTRALLSTAQVLLSILSAVVVPFWEVGFVYAAIRMARRQPTQPDSLLTGFRRFGPVLRLNLLQLVLYVGIGILALQLSVGIYILTPLSEPLLEALEALAAASEELIPDETVMQSLMGELTPLYVVFAAVFCVLAVPMAYRFRMAQYVVMDGQKSAFRAMITSHRMMKYNRFAMFRLDLSFWWFYALQLFSVLTGYLDVLLPLLGVTLPISSDVAFFLCYIVHCVMQVGIAWYAGSYVSTTYAVCYDVLLPEAQYDGGFRNPFMPPQV